VGGKGFNGIIKRRAYPRVCACLGMECGARRPGVLLGAAGSRRKRQTSIAKNLFSQRPRKMQVPPLSGTAPKPPHRHLAGCNWHRRPSRRSARGRVAERWGRTDGQKRGNAQTYLALGHLDRQRRRRGGHGRHGQEQGQDGGTHWMSGVGVVCFPFFLERRIESEEKER